MNSPTAVSPAHPRRWLSLNRNETLFDALLPGAKTWHRIVAAIAMIALIIACSKIRFYLPDNPTPITLQTFAVLLSGSVLGWRWGTASVFGYLALGALGFTVFANQSLGITSPADGWTYVTGVTGGYLIGFVLASALTGALSQAGFIRSSSLWAIVVGGLAVYIPALIWLAVGDFGWPAEGKLMMDGMYIYIPGDVLKILAASLVVGVMWRLADNRRSGQE